MLNPGLIQRTCAKCKAGYYVDPEPPEPLTGKEIKRIRFGQHLARPPGASLPCAQCPKANPKDGERADRYVLHAAAALELYYQIQACCGRHPALSDRIVQRHMGIVGRVVRASEQQNMSATIRNGLMEASFINVNRRS